MFDILLNEFEGLMSTFTNERGFFGIFGVLLFAVIMIAEMQLPSVLRKTRRLWFLLAIGEPLLVLALGSLIVTIFSGLNHSVGHEVTGPVYSVPMVLIAAHLLNRGMLLFVWRGVLAGKASVVPQIIWNILDVIVYLAAIFAILSFIFDQHMTGLLVSSGVVVGILGLSLQPILGDVIAGIGLTVEQPFVTGDWVELEGGEMGEIINMDWRATEIRTWHNTVHVVPNSKLAGASIHNYERADGAYGFWFYVTVARSVSPELVRRLILEASLKSGLVLDDPVPAIKVWDTEDHPIKYMIFVHCSNYRLYFSAKDEILRHCWALFTKAGFNFAASPQDIEFRPGEPHEASEIEVAVLLRQIPLLAPLEEAERSQLAHDGVMHSWGPGSTIISENTVGDSMYIILSGMVQIQRTMEDGKVLNLARLGTYDYFGEMSLLTGESRSASVVTHTECQVLEIAKSSIEPLFHSRPELVEEIANLMAERKLKSELLTSESKKISVADRLKNYSEAFASSIRSFFGK
jgi:small-conductance mechanosensitive channel/CRP-like cAMP-binding protein